VEELGIAQNTLILFTSDNGGHRTLWEGFDTNGPLRGHKRDLYEGGIRVPFIARWPGKIPAGETSHEIIAFQDLMPTFAELTGLKTRGNIDGISAVRALMGKELKETREYLYWDYGHCRERYDQAVRYGFWKGIRQGENGRIQLYNLEKDIGEEHDLASVHPEIIVEIEQIMESAVKPSDRYRVGDLYTGGPIWKPNNN
jgi:arylsulfatase A-like enzyme